MQFGSKEEEIFYSVSDVVRDQYPIENNLLMKTSIVLDPEMTEHTRTVYSIMDVIAQIGGIFSVVRALSLIILSFYAKRMMYYCVLRK